ncbi:hypothetical protein [Streptomyces brevispora]
MTLTIAALYAAFLGEPNPYSDPAERKAKRDRDRIRAMRNH